ncbi:Uncharacterised protein [Staphylococcus gallinarum]|uniref:Beta-glucuronidase n=1 Tax=Staphylococcus gallinarum TaxID=1293 RepID=A0A380FMM7_STAGA|nr:Uncharacterised protein [Staphylococcus gallinarum]
MLYPVINEKRQIIDLNGIWNFKLEDDASPVDISKTTRHGISDGSSRFI